jgi:RHS repeat-associated protein
MRFKNSMRFAYICFFALSFNLLLGQAINNINLVVVNGDSIAQQEVRLLAPNGKATSTGALQSRLHIDKNIMLPNSYQSSPNSATTIRTHNTNLPVGTINGAPSVDQNGGSNYSIKIDMAPGTKGMMPDISVNYNHNQGDGQLGLGWSIGGISSIKKANYTWFQDQVTQTYRPLQSLWAPLVNNLTTPLYLNGTKLVPLSSVSTPSMFLLEDDNQTQISYLPTGNYFLVETADGLKMEYGRNSSTNGSLLKINTNSTDWYLNKVYDNYGNYMEYFYHNIDNEIAIKEIRYTGNTNTSMAAYNSVKFYYNKRSDPKLKYHFNDSLKYKMQLREIETFCEGSSLYRYEFKYAFEDFNYLNEIIQYSGKDRFNSTAFVYGLTPGVLSSVQAAYLLNASGNNAPVENYVTADFNNDGKTDILEMKITGGVAATQLNGFVSYNGFNLYLNTGNGSFQLQQSVSLPTGYFASAFFGNYGHLFGINANPNAIETGDINGDGYIDLVYPTANASNINSLLVAWKFDPATNQFVNLNLPATDYSFKINGAISASFNSISGGSSMMMGDFDGNGTSDVLTITKGASSGSGPDESKFFNLGASQIASITAFNNKVVLPDNSTENLFDYSGFSAADYDGDGKTDILCYKYMGTSNSKFTVFRLNVSTNNLLSYSIIADFPASYSGVYPADHASPGDYNGDGYLDFISHPYLSTEKSGIFYGTGSSFTFPKKDNSAIGLRGLNKKFIPLDINADGVTDLVKIEKFSGHIDVSAILGQDILTASAYRLYASIATPPPTAENLYTYCTMPPIKDYYHPNCDYDYDRLDTIGSLCFNINTDLDDVFDLDANKIPYFGTGDFDGDGYNDIIMRRQCSSGTPWLTIIHFKFKYVNKFLTKVVDGLNLETNFTYATVAKNSNTNYSKSTTVYTYPSPRVNFPLNIATSMSFLNPANLGGNSTNQTYEYFYEDLIVNKTGRGLLGFMKVNTKNVLTGMFEENTYTIEPNFIIKVPFQTKIKSTALNTTLRTTTNLITLINKTQPDNLTPSPLPPSMRRRRYFMQPTSFSETDHTRNVTVVKTSTYDSDNNLTQNVTDVGGGKEIITTVYSNFISAGSGATNKPQKITSSKIYLSQSPASTRVTDLVYNTTLGHVDYSIYETGAAHSIRTDYTYNSIGLLTQKVISAPNDPFAPDPVVSQYQYDSKFRFGTKEISDLGYTTMQKHDPRFGVAIESTDVDGLSTKMQYDNFGRLKSLTEPGGYKTTTDLFWYTANNQMGGDPHPVNAQVVKYFTETKPEGRPWLLTYYDIAGRAVKEISPSFNKVVSYLTDYDILGNVKKQSGPYPVPLITGVPYFTTNYTYSTDKNELTTLQTTDGTINNTTGFAYSYNTTLGQMDVSTTRPDGIVSTQRTDATGKLIKIIDMGGNVEHTYTNDGQLATSVLSGVNVLTNAYNAAGFLSTETQPNTGTKTFNFNAYGQLKTMTDANTNNFSFDYDKLGRPITSVSGTDVYAMVYKNTSPGMGQMDNVSLNNNTEASFKYDNMSRLISLNEKINNTTYTSKYEYGYLGRVVKKKYPDNYTLKYTYDQQSYPLTIEEESSHEKIWEAIDMDYKDNYTAYKKGAVQMSESFNSLGLPKKYFAPGVQSLIFDFDNQNGNLKSITDGIKNNIIEEYDYDNLDRLRKTKINQTNQLNIFYDARGNITSKFDGGTLTPDATKHDQVIAASNPNADINTVGQDITYTSFDKAKKIIEGVNELEFTYGPMQERMQAVYKQNGSTTYRRIYLNECEMDFDAANNLVQSINYISAPSGLCAMQVKQGTVKKLYFPYFNHLGSILTVTDKNGLLVAEQNFDAWGRRRNATTWAYTNLNTLPAWLHRGYTGHEMLEQFDLVNMNGRMYDPKVGRMLSADPVLQPEFGTQAYNKYSYVFNNPLKYTDPSGYASTKAHQTFNQAFNNALYGNSAGSRLSADEYSNRDKSGAIWSSSFNINHSSGFDPTNDYMTITTTNRGTEKDSHLNSVFEHLKHGEHATFSHETTLINMGSGGGDDPPGSKSSPLNNVQQPFAPGEFLKIMNSPFVQKLIADAGTASGAFGVINGSAELKFIAGSGGKPVFKDYLFQKGEFVGRELAMRNYKFSRGLKTTGKFMTGFGMLTDLYGTFNYFTGKNETKFHVVHPIKLGLNTAFTAIGTFGGPFGFGLSTGYFMLDQISTPTGCASCPVFNKFVMRQDNLKPKIR